MPIINGRRVSAVPNNGVYGWQLIDELKPDQGRRPVLHRSGMQFESIEPHKRYSKRDNRNNPF